MLSKLILSTLGFLTLMNCQSKKNVMSEDNYTKTEVSSSNGNLSTTISLKEGEKIFLKPQQMNITFKGIVSDSRCPEGVNCIWAGAATASVEIMTTTSRPMLIELSSLDLPSKNFSKTQNVAGYNITLEKVLPYPNQTNNTANLKGQYRIALKIEKGNATTTTTAKPIATE